MRPRPSDMATTRTLAVVQRFNDAFNRHDVAAIMALMTGGDDRAPGSRPDSGKPIDLEMVMPGGRERAAGTFRTWVARGGFDLPALVPETSPRSVTDPHPAGSRQQAAGSGPQDS